MTITQQQRVEAPIGSPSPFGLSSLLTFREGNGPHWQGGIVWQSPYCLEPGIWTELCTAESPDPKVPLECPAIESADPVTVYAYLDRSGSWSLDDLVADGSAVLDVSELDAALTHYLPEWFTAGPSATTSLTLALADAEAFIGRRQGVILVGEKVATLLAAEGLLRVEGSRLFTFIGTPVVITGTDEGTAGALPIHATAGPIFGYRSERFSHDAFDRHVNDWSVLVERTFLLAHDCGAATFTAPAPV